VGRTLHPTDDAFFTWWAPWRNLKQRNIGWRIDYVVASAPLAASAATCVVQREFGTSDHGPVVATFA
jgi:exodeoxyribonuclease-3